MSYQITYSTIRHIINGEVIDAQVLNRPILDLTNRTNTELDNLYNYTNDTFFRNDGGVINGEVEVTGNTHFGKDVTVAGNFYVKGQTTQVDNRISTGDVKLTLNYGEQGAGVTAGFSGIEIDRGSLANFVFGFDEDNDVFAIGKGTGNLQPLTTRELEPHPNGTMVWDAENKRLKSYTDVDYRQLINVRQHGTGSTQVRDNAQNDSRFLRRSRNLDDLSNIDSAREVLRIEKLDNTADEDKPISNATQAALNTKADKTVAVSAGNGLTGGGNLGGNFVIRMGEPSDVTISSENSTSGNSHTHRLVLSPADINLGNVDNTSDVDKPVSTAQQTALNMKVDKTTRITAGSGLTGGGLLSADRTVTLGTPSTITIATENSVSASSHTHEIAISAADIDLGNVDNTSDADKPVSTAQQAALDTKVDKRSGYELSQNDFTDQRLGKLNSIETGAQVNRPITVERNRTATGTTLDAVAMRDHIQSGDHDFRYYTKTQIDNTVDGLEDSISATNQNISDNYVPRVLEVTAGDGLSGGGSLEQSRTFSVNSTVLRTNAEQTIIAPKSFTAATRYQTDIGNYTIQQGTTNLGTVSFNSRSGNAAWYFDTNEIDLLEFRSHSGGASYRTDFEMNFSAGEFKAPKFVGDGSNLTSLQTTALTGTISYSNLPISATNVSNWNTAYAERGSQIAGTGLSWASGNLNIQYGTSAGTAAQGNDLRLSNAREWTAVTVSESEARAGTATTRRAWTSQRVRQNVQEFVESYTDAFDTNGDYSGLRARATTAADVGLGNVDNTSDADKPVSITQQNALNQKVDNTRTITAGDGLSGGGNLGSNRTISVDGTVARYGTGADQIRSNSQLDNRYAQTTDLGTSAFLDAGASNGVATLDASGKVPLSQISDTVLGQVEYKGTWNASTNQPTLPQTPDKKGDYYVVSNDGTFVGITFKQGDWIISKGDSWEKVDNTDAVTSVNGKIGSVTLNASDVGAVPTGRTITAGTGLTGGGALSANRTIEVDFDVFDARYVPTAGTTLFNADGTYPNLRAQATTAADVGAPPTSRTINITTGGGLSGGATQSLASNRTWSLSVDSTVVRTSGAQTIGGAKKFTSRLTVENGSYEQHLELIRGSIVARINPSTGNNSGVSNELRFEGTNVNGYWFDGRVAAEDGFFGTGGGITGLNASNLSSGSVSDARLPKSGNWDTAYAERGSQIAGTGLTWSSGNLNIQNPFSPTGNYASLRARGTTKADVGLGSVRNVASYSQTESDGRYARNNGDSLTGRYRINTTDDGTSDLQVGGDTSLLGNVGIGNRNPSEGLDVEGDVRVRDEGAVKFGGTGGTSASVSIQFNESTQSIDFNFI